MTLQIYLLTRKKFIIMLVFFYFVVRFNPKSLLDFLIGKEFRIVFKCIRDVYIFWFIQFFIAQ